MSKIVTTETFKDEVLNCDKPVMVDFFAVWCGPCSMIAPVIDEIGEEHPEIKVCKVNVDESKEIAMEYGIRNIPTIIFFKNGEAVKKEVGARDKEEYEVMIQDIIG